MHAPYIEDTNSIANPMQVLLIALNYTIVGYNESFRKTGARLTVKKPSEATPKPINMNNICDAKTRETNTNNNDTGNLDSDATKPYNTRTHRRIKMDPSFQVKKEMIIDSAGDNKTKNDHIMNIDGSEMKPSSNETKTAGHIKTIPMDNMYHRTNNICDNTMTPTYTGDHDTVNINSYVTESPDTKDMMIDPVQQKKQAAVDHHMKMPVCKGECCSRYGINFIECITSTFNVNTIAIDDIMFECHFVEGKYSETMTNKEKRFLLYWWFATNIYLVCGRHNRCELPDCLIEKIRKVYPNPQGEQYVGHKKAKKKK